MARRRYGLEAPDWAPHTVDADIQAVQPLPGWVLVEEDFERGKTVTVHGIELALPVQVNTVYGRVVAVAAQDTVAIRAGDQVIYREWEGGRWTFRGRQALLIGSEHILATVED